MNYRREVVNGVRRVWGILRSASHFTVRNTIVKLPNVSNIESMEVKRKYTFRKPKWWNLLCNDWKLNGRKLIYRLVGNWRYVQDL